MTRKSLFEQLKRLTSKEQEDVVLAKIDIELRAVIYHLNSIMSDMEEAGERRHQVIRPLGLTSNMDEDILIEAQDRIEELDSYNSLKIVVESRGMVLLNVGMVLNRNNVDLSVDIMKPTSGKSGYMPPYRDMRTGEMVNPNRTWDEYYNRFSNKPMMNEEIIEKLLPLEETKSTGTKRKVFVLKDIEQ